METLIILLFSLAIILLILSFFSKDKVAKLEEDLEQMTITYMHDMYQLKKKVKILEGIIEDDPVSSVKARFQHPPVSSGDVEPIHEILKSQVLSLYRQGLSLAQIAKQSSLTEEQTLSVIEQQGMRGNDHD
ncbi:hypothetical protein GW626_14275 [Peribacillus muralis]|uniref:hypothetical protein n=1 Tax=Peribacillus muralis TaxID=264697 RepID=UPI001F4DE57E|nr:hypothetical protein [Peribacillus muralis]MCK1991508.1 hypothetical protein [Peribacillus muralis]MCK2012067.1 hypothetical protein [Peribacillus muralis]